MRRILPGRDITCFTPLGDRNASARAARPTAPSGNTACARSPHQTLAGPFLSPHAHTSLAPPRTRSHHSTGIGVVCHFPLLGRSSTWSERGEHTPNALVGVPQIFFLLLFLPFLLLLQLLLALLFLFPHRRAHFSAFGYLSRRPGVRFVHSRGRRRLPRAFLACPHAKKSSWSASEAPSGPDSASSRLAKFMKCAGRCNSW